MLPNLKATVKESPTGISSAEPSAGPRHRRRWGVAIALFAATFILFFPVGDNGFINFDTPEVLTENDWVTRGFTVEGVKRAFSEGHWNLWHPLTTLSHMLDCELFGLDPRGHHLMNAGIHAVSAAALFLVLSQITGRFWPAALAAAMFAFHPLRVESVAWAAERKDTLCALFWILTMGAYGRYAAAPSKRRYAVMLVVFGLGLMTKPTIVTLPFALLLLDVWPLGRVRQGGASSMLVVARENLFLAREKIPMFVGVAALSLVTVKAQMATAVVSLEEAAMGARLSNAAVSYVRYLWLTLWPNELCVFYPLPVGGWSALATLFSVAFLLLVSWWTVRNRAMAPWLPVMWLWFLGTLVPNIGIVQSGVQAMADRFSYIPSIGLAVAAAWAGAWLVRKYEWQRSQAFVAVGCLTLGMAVATRAQIRHWKESETLFSRTVEVTGSNPVAEHNLATALLGRGEIEMARPHFLKVLESDPGHVEANIGAGITLEAVGRLEEAAVRYRVALETDAVNVKAANNLGSLLVSLERPQEALAVLSRARALAPNDPDVLNNLGLAWASTGELGKAIEAYDLALKASPNHLQSRQNLGVALMESGRDEEAGAAFRAVVEQEPGMAPALTGLGILARRSGREAEAVNRFRRALESDPGLALARHELIDALAQSGDHRGALVELQFAMRSDPEDLENPLRYGWILAASTDKRLRNGAMAARIAGDLQRVRARRDHRDLDLLAAAEAERGRFDAAQNAVERGIKLARETGVVGSVSEMQGRLTLYRAGMPYRFETAFP